MPDLPDDDPLSALGERVRSAQAAAERLAEEARLRGEVPGASRDTTEEVQALVALMQAVRGLVPEELWEQLTQLVRQLLLLVRAILDWWLERLEQGPGAGGEGSAPDPLEDIPVQYRRDE